MNLTDTALGQQLATALDRIGDELHNIREAVAGRTASVCLSLVRVSTIVAVTAEFYGVSQSDLRGPAGNQTVEQARAMAMYLCRDMTDQSLVAIGWELGQGYMAVMCAEKRLRAAVGQDQPIAAEVGVLVKRIVAAHGTSA